MPSTLKPQNTPLISSLPAPKQEIKPCLQRESNFPGQGEDASNPEQPARKQGPPHPASFKLKLVTDAVTVSCVNSIDWVADSLRSLHARTINPAAVSPATLLNS